MSLLPAKPFLEEVHSGEPIPPEKLAYFEQRALNGFYDYVMTRFLEEKERSQLTKAKLAERIGRGPDQINRWLASPTNWTIATVARLLVGIAGEEPVLSSESLLGRVPTNEYWESVLGEDVNLPELQPPPTKHRNYSNRIAV